MESRVQLGESQISIFKFRFRQAEKISCGPGTVLFHGRNTWHAIEHTNCGPKQGAAPCGLGKLIDGWLEVLTNLV